MMSGRADTSASGAKLLGVATNPSPETWASTLLHALGIPQTPGAIQALVGWERAEGGHWKNNATYNPLNTTQNMPGAGNTGSQGNIKQYSSWDQGIDATVQTLKNGRYGRILSALRAGDPNAVASAIDGSPWGTHGNLIYSTIGSTRPVRGVQPFGDVGASNTPGAGNQPSAVAGSTPSTATLGSGGAGDYTSLLASLLPGPTQAPQSMPVAPPAFAASPRLPQGFAPAGAAPAQAASGVGSGLLDALAAASASGGQGTGLGAAAAGSVAQPTASAAGLGTGGTPAVPSSSTSSGGNVVISPRFKPGDPVVSSRQSVGGEHPTDNLPGYPAHDYFAPAGTNAVAPVGGKIIRLSGNDPRNGPSNGPHGPLGWSVYIQGTDGRTYYLTHMGSRNVKVGQTVKPGQVIGTVADYDKYGTPSHIHMGINGG